MGREGKEGKFWGEAKLERLMEGGRGLGQVAGMEKMQSKPCKYVPFSPGGVAAVAALPAS